jgi:peroxiredoxin
VDQLRRGDRFPDLALDSLDGPVRLSERWTGQPLVVAFMRHFGCPFCREHLIQLSRHHDQVRAAGTVAIAHYNVMSPDNPPTSALLDAVSGLAVQAA